MSQVVDNTASNTDQDPVLRVLIVDLSHEFGGASSRALGLMSGYPAGQIALAAVTGSPVFNQAQRMGLTVHGVGTKKTDWHILPNLTRLIRENGYQVLDTQNIQSKIWGSLAGMQTGVALVSTLNSWYGFEHGKSLKGRLYTALELLTNRSLDGYIVVSKTVRDALQEAEKNAPFIDLIYNAIGLKVDEIEGGAGWLRSEFNLPADAVVCSAVGRLVWAKGYEDLIEAFAQVSRVDQVTHCLIIGDGELREDLAARIKQYGLDERVRLVGYQDRKDVLAILKASDIFVMPSRQEGTPIALLEAAAVGTPILATACGGIPEVVESGKQAILVTPGDTQALAEALIKLSRDPLLRSALAESAQVHVNLHYNLQVQVKATQAAYQKAFAHNKLHRT